MYHVLRPTQPPTLSKMKNQQQLTSLLFLYCIVEEYGNYFSKVPTVFMDPSLPFTQHYHIVVILPWNYHRILPNPMVPQLPRYYHIPHYCVILYLTSQSSEEHWMFSVACLFVCPHDNFGTSKHRMMKLGGQVNCTKISAESQPSWQCDFRFDLFFSFSFRFSFPVIFQFQFRFSFHHFFILVLVLVLPIIFSFQFRFSFAYFFVLVFASYFSVCKSYTAFTLNIKPADKDVLMICLNTVHRQSRIQRRTAVAPVSAVLYASTFVQ